MKNNKKAISFGYPTCVFLILILLSGTSYGDVANILINPDFESSATGNWVARSCTYTRTTSQKHGGSYSGLASRRTATWNGIQQNVLGKMVQDQTYAVSGWVRTTSIVNPTVHLTFEKTDGSGTTYAWGASGTANNSAWTYISGSYTLTVNGTLTGLNVYVESSDLNNIYLDDANVFGQVPSPTNPNATGQVNFTVTHQTLDGFGAAGAWYDGTVVTLGNSNPNIYKILFSDLGLDIYRIRNAYNVDSDNGIGYITDTNKIITAGEARLGHPLRIMNTSWSPPASLKSNGNTRQGTLAKDTYGNYRYADFAQWWADSLTAWSNAGVDSYYLNMQNEPGFQSTDWDTCQFDPTEDTSYAGYEPAFAALCTKLNSLPSRPILLAPEGQDTTSTPSYVNALTAADKANVYGYSHHLYNGDASNPDGLIAPMATLKAAIGGDNKPLLQTEFSGSEATWTDAMNLAKLIYNAMTVEEVSAYLYWELFWAPSSGLVSVTNTSYTINPVYYALMHYSRFTDPGWQRVDANSTSSDLRITAYKDPCEPNAAIIVINTSTTTDVNLTLSLNGFNPGNSGIYQSKSDANFAYIGTFSTSNKVLLPKQSITTIHLAGFGDCNSVQAGGYRLDSDLNGDCYVDLQDLLVFANNWLYTNCVAPGNCQNADFVPTNGTVDFFDFADFGPQWRQCNNPLDANCTPNWPL
jgi:glucuronoarabinoxylan endo-1,4-beta-xylanase